MDNFSLLIYILTHLVLQWRGSYWVYKLLPNSHPVFDELLELGVGLLMVLLQYFTAPPHSIWTPRGPHRFHMEWGSVHMDSTWNGGQSTWIPHGMEFIPHGFHMEWGSVHVEWRSV